MVGEAYKQFQDHKEYLSDSQEILKYFSCEILKWRQWPERKCRHLEKVMTWRQTMFYPDLNPSLDEISSQRSP